MSFGWCCSSCGQWVRSGQAHSCIYISPVVSPQYFPPASLQTHYHYLDPEISRKLDEILRLLNRLVGATKREGESK
jgi:hypothetical protein